MVKNGNVESDKKIESVELIEKWPVKGYIKAAQPVWSSEVVRGRSV